MELWTMRIPETGTVVAQAERAERAGLGRHHVHRLAEPRRRPVRRRRARGRARPSGSGSRPASPTRTPAIPAALANVAATVQETSGGRFVLGIGRGDTALFHLGLQADAGRPRSSRSVTDLQTYLAERHRRLRRAPEPAAVARPVPASRRSRSTSRRPGPRMIEFAAPHRRARHARGRRRPRPGRLGARPRPQGRGRRGPRPGRDLVRRVRQRRLPSRPRRGPRR